jgi:hypothetical protein
LYTTEELLDQQKASDSWAWYQAKSIRRYASEIARDTMAAMGDTKAAERYSNNVAKYLKDEGDRRKDATELERVEAKRTAKRPTTSIIPKSFWKIGIVFASLAILTKRALLWWTAIRLRLRRHRMGPHDPDIRLSAATSKLPERAFGALRKVAEADHLRPALYSRGRRESFCAVNDPAHRARYAGFQRCLPPRDKPQYTAREKRPARAYRSVFPCVPDAGSG